MDCSSPGSSVHGIIHSRIPEWVAIPSPGDLPNPEIELGSPALQVDSLPSELQGKCKNTGMGSLSLLEGTFPTQELNWGLLHCRWILYPLSHRGSPRAFLTFQRVPCPTFLSIPTTSSCHLSSLLLEQQFRSSRTSLMHMICIKIFKKKKKENIKQMLVSSSFFRPRSNPKH